MQHGYRGVERMRVQVGAGRRELDATPGDILQDVALNPEQDFCEAFRYMWFCKEVRGEGEG